MEIRNVAIIAHVDHGKTTLVRSIIGAIRYFKRKSTNNGIEQWTLMI